MEDFSEQVDQCHSILNAGGEPHAANGIGCMGRITREQDATSAIGGGRALMHAVRVCTDQSILSAFRQPMA
ncbi:hypothetical protein D3C80_1782560 [compost metagenome]